MDIKKIFLIDGNSYAYRAFYAIRELSNSAGLPTNAVFGFVNMLRKILKEENPEFLAVCFDMKYPTFRHEIYEEYKISRKPMPDNLIIQMPLIKRVLESMNIPVFEKKGFEADDIIASLVKKFKSEDTVIYIASTDKDILQLIEKNIKVYRADIKKGNMIFGKLQVKEKYGVEPKKIPDLLALMGDVSDSIPGVPGIGCKSASEIINRFGSIEDILVEIKKANPEKKLMKIKENKNAVVTGKKLTLLKDDIYISSEIEDLRFNLDFEKLISVLKELEFKTLIQKAQSKKFI